MDYRLGIDLGTTTLVAAAAPVGAPVELVNLGAPGPTVTVASLRDPTLTAVEASAALLRLARDRAAAQFGGPPSEIVLAEPGYWSEPERAAFDQAVDLADLGPLRRLTQAEAAAAGYAAQARLPIGARIAVFDLGAGSCEATVLERTPTGFTILGSVGGPHPSGNDVDEAVYRFILGGLGDRARDPNNPALLASVRLAGVAAKEELSTRTQVELPLPALHTMVRLGRPELESLVRGPLRDGIAMVTQVLREAGVAATDLTAIVAVGGCSRMPIVAALLDKEFSIPIAVSSRPELAVALGAAGGSDAPAPIAAPPPPVVPTPVAPMPVALPPAAPPPAPAAVPIAVPPRPVAPPPPARVPVVPVVPVATVPPVATFPPVAPVTPVVPVVPLAPVDPDQTTPRNRIFAAAPLAEAASQVPPPPRGTPLSGYAPPPEPDGGRGPGGHVPRRAGPTEDAGPRKRLFLIIAGAVVLTVALAGVVFALLPLGRQPLAATSTTPLPTTITSSSSTSSTSPPTSTTPSSTTPSTTTSGQSLPTAAALPQSVVVVPMRRGSGTGEALYLVDNERTLPRVTLPAPAGNTSNPLMQPSRGTIIYIHQGVLRVMASDGSGDRRLFKGVPAGCDHVLHASWALTNPNVLLISCRLTPSTMTLSVINLEGKLIRRLTTGKKVIGDFSVSPDGRTVVYWASDDPKAQGGSLYTLPLTGTRAPTRLTQSPAGVDSYPAWSPDGTKIAFSRRLADGSPQGNLDVFVMKADGSGTRAVATTPAVDFKAVWSPDNRNLLIISNRTSPSGKAGKYYDLWLTRASDGKVLRQLGLKAERITRPFWTLR